MQKYGREIKLIDTNKEVSNLPFYATVLFSILVMHTIIISPSGRYYGSEQVLYDYLTETSLTHLVALLAKGPLQKNTFITTAPHPDFFRSSFITLFCAKLYCSLADNRGKYSSDVL
ncbi:MAG: hypothetical protein IPO25_14910 [Saprospiraceae bacterium]|nr:hypothetical protein [Saprospiraceae bacterium]